MADALPIDGELLFVKNPIENLDLLDGGAYVLDFTASWCPPCRRVIPHITQLQKTYPNIKFIGVSNETPAQWKNFCENPNAGMDFHAAVDNTGALDNYREAYKITGIPFCILIDNKKVVFSGHPSDGQFDKLIEQIGTRQ